MANMQAVLQACLSPDPTQRVPAEEMLQQYKAQNLPQFMCVLAAELQNQGNDPGVRKQAGIQLKNCLSSKDPLVFQQLAQQWGQVDGQVREHIKQTVFGALGTEPYQPSQAAGMIAAIAKIELPYNLWPALIPQLVMQIKSPEAPEHHRIAALETLGYVCDGAESPEIFDPKVVDDILTAVVGCLQPQTPLTIKHAAIKALLNSLEFCSANFERDADRNAIMQAVCQCTQPPNTEAIIAVALESLVRIMSLYYVFMEHYMGQALFPITVGAMQSQNTKIALQAVEFWSNVCDEELELEEERKAAAPNPPEIVSKHYMKGALEHIVPMMCQLLANQGEYDEDDDWTVSKAASVCVSSIAQLCRDDVLQFVMPFVQACVVNPDWRFRDASLLAFGGILDGPDPDKLAGLAGPAIPHLISMMKDPAVQVRDTLAWVFGRICQYIPATVLNDENLNPLLTALSEGLTMDPRVATNVCWALYALAEAAYEQACDEAPEEDQPHTYLLSPHFNAMLQQLFRIADRPDADTCNLRSAAYEAMMALLQNFPQDCYPAVQLAAKEIFDRLKMSLGVKVDGRDLLQHTEIQSLLCASLQCLIRQMSKPDIVTAADQIMEVLFAMFQQSATASATNVLEDALMAVSALIEVMGEDFKRYIGHIKPYIVQGLSNVAEHQVCFVAVGVVGDIARALGQDILPFCEEFMHYLLTDLQNPALDKSVKPQILGAFGDLALAIGPHFKVFLGNVLPLVTSAAILAAEAPPGDDFDLIDHVAELRENCLSAFTGILQALKGDDKHPSDEVWLLKDHIPNMLGFIQHVLQDVNVTDGVIAACLGLFGDLCESFLQGLKPYLAATPGVYEALIHKGSRPGSNAKTKLLLKYAKKAYRKTG